MGDKLKRAGGFRPFLRREIDKAKAEGALICTAHNLTTLATAA
jgi:hypothetical protein